MKSVCILDDNYLHWVKELGARYRRSQIQAAVRVNNVMLKFYWELGRDITIRQVENHYGTGFYTALSRDLRRELPQAEGLSPSSIRYAKRFYSLYNQYIENLQQVAEEFKNDGTYGLTLSGDKNFQQLAEDLFRNMFSIPWGHHMLIIDKCSDSPQKAFFYVKQTVENGWSRSMLLNFISTDLYERSGKALNNFERTLPAETSDLAQELLKDPYNFAFTGITGAYNERCLKEALLHNITKFLVELGTGFAYVGKEYRLEVGETENFIDLLFYNLRLSCYVVVEVKIGKFAFADTGQLGGYVVACNHSLRKEGRDNPTIGLLICKEKDRIQAQYALESSSQPIGISEYDLERFYPETVEGIVPTIEEIEAKLNAVALPSEE